jgi:hypothetical protein
MGTYEASREDDVIVGPILIVRACGRWPVVWLTDGVTLSTPPDIGHRVFFLVGEPALRFGSDLGNGQNLGGT